MKTNKIFFIGPRASGKTTLGKKVATILNREFIDTDEFITKIYNMSISSLVHQKGWDFFRKIEHETILKICNSKKNCIIATGGGIILLKENRKLLREHGTVFYLKTPLEVLLNRLKDSPSDTTRPPLTQLSLEDEVRVILKEREKFYEQTAHYILNGSEEIPSLLKNIQKIIISLKNDEKT